MAPETPFPGAIDDCFAATAWIAESANELGIDSQRIAVGGKSAGANLAACVAYRARENGLPLVFQLLVYPVILCNIGAGLISSSQFWSKSWCRLKIPDSLGLDY